MYVIEFGKALTVLIFLTLLFAAPELGFSFTLGYFMAVSVLAPVLGFGLMLGAGCLGVRLDERARAKRRAAAAARRQNAGQ